jgi:hypothetical protein
MGSSNTKVIERTVEKQVLVKDEKAQKELELMKYSESSLESMHTKLVSSKAGLFNYDDSLSVSKSVGDKVMMKYSQLSKAELLMDVGALFNGVPGQKEILTIAENVIDVIYSSSSLKEVERELHNVVDFRAGNTAVRVQYALKFKYIDADKWYKGEKIVQISYIAELHKLTISPDRLMSYEEICLLSI